MTENTPNRPQTEEEFNAELDAVEQRIRNRFTHAEQATRSLAEAVHQEITRALEGAFPNQHIPSESIITELDHQSGVVNVHVNVPNPVRGINVEQIWVDEGIDTDSPAYDEVLRRLYNNDNN